MASNILWTLSSVFLRIHLAALHMRCCLFLLRYLLLELMVAGWLHYAAANQRISAAKRAGLGDAEFAKTSKQICPSQEPCLSWRFSMV